MTDKRNLSLESYARRRYALAGSEFSGHFPYCSPMESLNVRRDASGDGLISFAHYDYLGLSRDRRIADAVHDTVDQLGFGAGASRLVGGEIALHRALERDISDFLGVEDTLVLVSGYCANFSLVSHIMTKDDLVLFDEACHNSIIAGAHASRAQTVSFQHNDLAHLTELLATRRGEFRRVLVIVEGLYSMDGDIPNLPALLKVCRQLGVWLMVDEAHSIGVLGATGRGICEHFGIAPSEVDLIVGTLSKAFAGSGGFISAKQDVIDWLRFTLPGFVYSVGMAPPAIASARRALAILREEPHRLRKLRDNSAYFLAQANARGLDTGRAIGAAVVPLLYPDNASALLAAHTAMDAGYFVPPIIHIAVPKEAPRLRCFLTANHTRAQIDGLLSALAANAAVSPAACDRSAQIAPGETACAAK